MPRRRRVLIVDDDPTTRALVRAAVAPHASVHENGSAEEALKILRESPVDVVVTDHLMGFMQGTDLLAIVARDRPHVRRVMISGYAEQHDRLLVQGIAHAILPKPVDVAKARAAILDQEGE